MKINYKVLIIFIILISLISLLNSTVGNIKITSFKNITVDYIFDAKQYRTLKLPGWCVSYMIFRNEFKRRPLYIYGWGSSGKITFIFDNEGGLREDYEVIVKGEGSVSIDQYSCTKALDWMDFACADWVNSDPHPPVIVTILKFEDLKLEAPDNLKLLLNPDRGIISKKEELKALFKADGLYRLSVGNKYVELRAPTSICIRDEEKYWSLKLSTEFSFEGAQLGLTGKDALKISCKLVTGAFGVLPEVFKTPTIKDMDKKSVDTDMIDNIF